MKTYLKILMMLFVIIGFTSCYNPNISEEGRYEAPEQINKPRLIYPKIAQENEISGDPKIMILISKEGTVEKANIAKSSGYEILDNAAVEYCKELLFKPAKRNGLEVASLMQIDINFNIAEPDYNINDYVRDVQGLYSDARLVGPSQKLKIENEILKKHDEFINNIKDGLNFNLHTSRILLPEVIEEWKNDWNAWPLSFLLYHDFLTRFKDYDSVDIVKLQLKNSLKEDLRFIQHTNSSDPEFKKDKENILKKINEFIRLNYPDIELDEIDHDV